VLAPGAVNGETIPGIRGVSEVVAVFQRELGLFSFKPGALVVK